MRLRCQRFRRARHRPTSLQPDTTAAGRELVAQYTVEFAVTKAALAPIDPWSPVALAGALLGFVTSLAFLVSAQSGKVVVGALPFPTGFVPTTLRASSC